MAAMNFKTRLFFQAVILTVIGGYMLLAAAPYFMESKDMTFSGITLIVIFSPVWLVMLYVFLRTIWKYFAHNKEAKQ